MKLRQVTFSDAPITMGDALLGQKAQAGDVEAVVKLLVSRSDLSLDEVLAVDLEDMTDLLDALGKALWRALVLAALGSQWEGANAKPSADSPQRR